MVSDAELAAVVAALAGVRQGDVVVALGAPALLRACLAAGAGRALAESGTAAAETARVVVAPAGIDVAAACVLLAPGGRLVATAENAASAGELADRFGLSLRHVERLGSRVAWAAVRPLGP